MNKIEQSDKITENYNNPVLNERDMRTSVGVLLLGAFIALMMITLKIIFTI